MLNVSLHQHAPCFCGYSVWTVSEHWHILLAIANWCSSCSMFASVLRHSHLNSGSSDGRPHLPIALEANPAYHAYPCSWALMQGAARALVLTASGCASPCAQASIPSVQPDSASHQWHSLRLAQCNLKALPLAVPSLEAAVGPAVATLSRAENARALQFRNHSNYYGYTVRIRSAVGFKGSSTVQSKVQAPFKSL